MGNAVTNGRSGRLKELEATIDRSAKAVWDMAQALSEIKRDKLWAETHGSWVAYCEDRWSISVHWADQTIGAIDVRDQLLDSTPGYSPPKSVRNASELQRVPPEDRVQVWQDAKQRAAADGQTEPTRRRHIEPAIADYQKRVNGAPPPPTKADAAHDAARRMRHAAEAFVMSVDSLAGHLDALDADEAQGCAYKIVETVHAVLETLRSKGALRDDVMRGVLGGEEIQEAVVVS